MGVRVIVSPSFCKMQCAGFWLNLKGKVGFPVETIFFFRIRKKIKNYSDVTEGPGVPRAFCSSEDLFFAIHFHWKNKKTVLPGKFTGPFSELSLSSGPE
jgi:hypothetical protein